MALALTALHVAVLFIAATIFIAAALNDAYTYRIPNYMSGLLFILFPAFIATAPYPIDWHQHLAVFALVAISGFAMFLGNLAGAGDIKLLSVASLWAGPHFIAVLVVVTAVAGGLESLIMAIIIYRRNRLSGEKGFVGKVPIPYGIALATGGVTVLAMMAQPILFPG